MGRCAGTAGALPAAHFEAGVADAEMRARRPKPVSVGSRNLGKVRQLQSGRPGALRRRPPSEPDVPVSGHPAQASRDGERAARSAELPFWSSRCVRDGLRPCPTGRSPS